MSSRPLYPYTPIPYTIVNHTSNPLFKLIFHENCLFGNLNWRSVGTVGNPSLYTFENDTGPDDANHARHGMYILHHPSLAARGRVDTASLYDVAPTVLTMMGLPVPGDMLGKSLV